MNKLYIYIYIYIYIYVCVCVCYQGVPVVWIPLILTGDTSLKKHD